VEFVRLRIQGIDEKVVIEMPMAVMEVLGKAEGEDVEIHLDGGREVEIPFETLVKQVRKASRTGEETLLFSVEEPPDERVSFFAQTFERKTVETAEPPHFVVLSSRDERGEPTRIRVSLALFTLLTDLIGEDPGEGDGFTPFIRSCLATAHKCGVGEFLRIESDDGVLTLSLE